MPRLPLANRDELLEELALIAHERGLLCGRIICAERRENYLASLKEWEDDLRAQLAEMSA